ncbi:MFS transporter [Streptomyces sp. NPDC020096]
MSEQTHHLPSAAPPPTAPAPRRWLSLAVLCLALLVVTLDNTILNVVLPTLVTQLHATSSELQWVVDSYTLVFAGLLLVAGSLADRIGRKRTFLAGLVVFIVGSTWAALSGSMDMLIAARAGMGIGAALIMPSTLSIVTTLFIDERERHRAFGIWAAVSGVGFAVGPIVGGLLLAHFWWGSVFLINVPIVALSLVCSAFLVPDSRNPVARRPDLIGAALSIAGLSLTLWAIIDAPLHGWTSGVVIGAGVGGLVVLTAFVLWELACAQPMLNLSFFRNRRFSAGVGTLAFVMLGGSGALFILTQYLQFDLGYTALESGLRVLPAAAAITVVAPLAAPLVRAAGNKVPVVAGLQVVAVGLWQLSGITTGTGYLATLPYMIMLGVGMGLVLPSATSSIMDSLPRAHTGVGSATNSTFMQIGTALGVAVIGSLQSTRYQDRLTGPLTADSVPHGVRETILGSLGGALTVAEKLGTAGAVLARLARAAFVSGMDLGLRTGAVVVLVAGVGAALALPARAKATRSEEAAGQEPADASGSRADLGA